MSTDELPRRADPAAGPVPQTDRGGLLLALQQGAASPATAPEGVVVAPPGARSRRAARTVLVRRRMVLGVAAVTAVAGAGSWALLGAGGPGGATPAAAAVLDRAATAAAAAGSGPVAGPGQYLRVTTDAVTGTTAQLSGGSVLSWLDRQVVEVWVPGTAGSPWVQRTGQRIPYRFFAPGDEQRARSAGALLLPGPAIVDRAVGGAFTGPQPASWPTPTPAFLAGLPRDPARLLDRIRHDTKGQGPSPDVEALVTIGDVLRYPVVPADLRAALFRAARLIPGVAVTADRTTLDGRAGTAVGLDNGGWSRYELVFDPRTAEIIGERDTILRANTGYPAGTVDTSTSVSTAVVSSAP